MYDYEGSLIIKLLLKALEHTPTYELVGFRQLSDVHAFCVLKKANEDFFVVEHEIESPDDIVLSTKLITGIYNSYKDDQKKLSGTQMVSYPSVETLWISPITHELTVKDVICMPPIPRLQSINPKAFEPSFLSKIVNWFGWK